MVDCAKGWERLRGVENHVEESTEDRGRVHRRDSAIKPDSYDISPHNFASSPPTPESLFTYVFQDVQLAKQVPQFRRVRQRGCVAQHALPGRLDSESQQRHLRRRDDRSSVSGESSIAEQCDTGDRDGTVPGMPSCVHDRTTSETVRT